MVVEFESRMSPGSTERRLEPFALVILEAVHVVVSHPLDRRARRLIGGLPSTEEIDRVHDFCPTTHRPAPLTTQNRAQTLDDRADGALIPIPVDCGHRVPLRGPRTVRQRVQVHGRQRAVTQDAESMDGRALDVWSRVGGE
jgi:hypothetical protein